MTETTPTDQPKGSWKTLQADLKGRGAGGDRHPFFPLAGIESGQTVAVLVMAGPFIDANELHGQYSLVELDVSHKGDPYRLCASGARLASQLAALEPTPGQTVKLTPKGTGKNRTWTASLA